MSNKPRQFFSISLRSATLSLAGSLAAWNLFWVLVSCFSKTTLDFEYWQFNLDLLSITIGLVGVYGIIKKNVKFVKVFSGYYWLLFLVDVKENISFLFVYHEKTNTVSEQSHQSPDITSEHQILIFCLIAAVYIGFTVIQFYFRLSVWNYLQSLEYEQKSAEFSYIGSVNTENFQHAHLIDIKNLKEGQVLTCRNCTKAADFDH